MSSQITKFGLLSFLSTALAAPFYPSGYAGSSAPWGFNSTGPYAPTGSGTGYPSYTDSTLTTTVDSTKTIVETVYVTPIPVESLTSVAAGESSVIAAGESSVIAAGASSTADICGPETIYVTAKVAVTVTVTPSVYSSTTALVLEAAVPSPSSKAAYHSHHHGHSSAASASAAAYTPPAYTAPVASSATSVYSAPSVVVPSIPASSVVVPVSTAVPVPSSVAVSSVDVPASSVVASSSAAASSTSTPSTYKGTKRGLAYNDASLTNAFKGECSWAYNWEHIPKGLDSSFEYIPMLKSSDFYIDSWEEDYKSAIDAGSTAVLSLNEPDNAGQANMSPAAAAAFHIANLNKVKTYKSTVQIGAPAVTNSQQAGEGLEWFTQFEAACAGQCKYDFVPVHWYDAASKVQAFKDHVTQAHTNTGKTIWVTEFAPNSGTDAEIASFLKETMAWIEQQSFIERVAYFYVDNALVSGGAKSTLGNLYVSA
jgi:hypothetical protein